MKAWRITSIYGFNTDEGEHSTGISLGMPNASLFSSKEKALRYAQKYIYAKHYLLEEVEIFQNTNPEAFG